MRSPRECVQREEASPMTGPGAFQYLKKGRRRKQAKKNEKEWPLRWK